MNLPRTWLALAGAALIVATACAPSAAPANPTTGPGAAQPTAGGAPAGGAQAGPTTAARPARTDKVAVALPIIAQSQFLYVVAREKGYYAEEGIEAELQQVAPAVGVQGVVAGNYQFSTAVTQSAIAGLTGAPMRVLFNTQTMSWWLVASPQSGVRTIPELKGKTVGIEGPGTSSAAFTRALLRKNGVNDGEVNYVGLGPVPNWLQAVIGGAVDAGIAAEAEGLLTAQDQGLTEVAWYGRDVQGSLTGVAASETFLRGNPELVKRFVRASLRGLQAYRADRADMIALSTRILGQPEDFVARAYDLSNSLTLAVPMLDASVQQEYVELVKETLNLERAVAPGEVFDYGIVREVVQELGMASGAR